MGFNSGLKGLRVRVTALSAATSFCHIGHTQIIKLLEKYKIYSSEVILVCVTELKLNPMCHLFKNAK